MFVTDQIRCMVFLGRGVHDIVPAISDDYKLGRQLLIIQKLEIPTDYLPFIKNIKGGYKIK